MRVVLGPLVSLTATLTLGGVVGDDPTAICVERDANERAVIGRDQSAVVAGEGRGPFWEADPSGAVQGAETTEEHLCETGGRYRPGASDDDDP